MGIFRLHLFVLLLGSLPTMAQMRNLEEFHYGYGGFSIRAGFPSSVDPVNFELGDFHLWGNSFIWEQKEFRMRVSICSAIKAKRSIETVEKSIVIAKWKAELTKDIQSNSAVREKPYVFEGYQGTEIAVTAPAVSVTRLFFIKSLLIEQTITIDKSVDPAIARLVLDSFRLLNKTERTIAMIAEFTPPPLAQERPDSLPRADSLEQGILGPVRRVRDTFEPIGENARSYYHLTMKNEKVVVQETHFDLHGFTSVEIMFNQGLPDIITTWGWVDGKRVNLQSPVNYPYEGPVGGRMTAVSGSLTIPGLAKTPNESKYGNKIETKWDDKGRPLERRRFTSSGTLVYIERFIYDGNRCTIKTVDEGGGFIGTVRNQLDSNNNLLETETLGDNGSVYNSTRFEYLFDGKGNWIVKKAFVRSGVGRKAVSKPIGIYYRDISYFENSDTRQVGKVLKPYFRLM